MGRNYKAIGQGVWIDAIKLIEIIDAFNLTQGGRAKFDSKNRKGRIENKSYLPS